MFSGSASSFAADSIKSYSIPSSFSLDCLIAASELSIPMKVLPNCAAANNVVPEPQKQSSTMLFSDELCETIFPV